MINSDMRYYNYYTYIGENEYGEKELGAIPSGVVKMAINLTSQTTQDNINYKDSQYIGLTNNKRVDDEYIIEYGDELLKVLYVNPKGRLNQVFMAAL